MVSSRIKSTAGLDDLRIILKQARLSKAIHHLQRELPPFMQLQLLNDCGYGQCSPVGTIGEHGIHGIAHSDYPGAKGYFHTSQSVGIPIPIYSLMVMTHGKEDGFWERG